VARDIVSRIGPAGARGGVRHDHRYQDAVPPSA
jgi:hypothetical protein